MTRAQQYNSREELSERERMVLNSIVENFIQSAVPVGSRVVAKKSNMALSPATIRNVMCDLEEMGYLTHPHTSAGRVPTDKGYRFFVDSLMGVEQLPESQKKHIFDELVRVSKEVDSILEAASQVMARVSSQLGVVLSPRFYQGTFEKIELVPIAEKRALMVVSVKSGLVRTIVLQMETEFSRELLDKTARIINERLHGLSLREIKDTLDSRFRDVGEADPDLVRLIVQSVVPSIDRLEHRSLHYGGTQNIMVQPEFLDQQKLLNVLNLLESKEMLIHLFDQSEATGDLSITIGVENREELIKYCSLITTSYHIGNVTGTLGVLGPTRMNYSRIVSLVQFMARVLTQILEQNVGSAGSTG